MAINDPVSFPVLEQTTGVVTATVVANDMVTPLPAASLLTLTLSLYVIKADGSIQVVNSRNVQNVLNANGVVVTAGGLLTWSYVAADTTLVESVPFERHIAIFAWTASGVQGKKEVVLVVQKLARTA